MRVSKTCDLVHHVQQCTTSEAGVQESRPFWLAGEALFTKDIARPCQGRNSWRGCGSSFGGDIWAWMYCPNQLSRTYCTMMKTNRPIPKKRKGSEMNRGTCHKSNTTSTGAHKTSHASKKRGHFSECKTDQKALRRGMRSRCCWCSIVWLHLSLF
jgi:hypothetical protein